MSAAVIGRSIVLIADDDDDLRGAIADALRDEDAFDVVEARDGTEALALALSMQPHAIVLDHRMPGLSGADVIDRLRGAGISVPIIFMTAARDVAQLAGKLGVQCFLGKPFGVDELVALIGRALVGHC